MSTVTEIFETFIDSNKMDVKGREIGYIVYLYEVNGTFYAAVQQGRRTSNWAYTRYGASQNAKPFASLAAAKAWAYSTAKARIAGLK